MNIGALAAQRAPVSPKLARKAQDFEAMTIAAMLKPMFETVAQPAAPFGAGNAEKVWEPYMEQAIARQMENRGGLGLAGAIEAALQGGRR